MSTIYAQGLEPHGKVFLHLPDDEGLSSRFDKEDWDAVQLTPSYWLLLDSNRSIARRIGLIEFDCHVLLCAAEFDLPPQMDEIRMIRVE
jgi:hypothetical protein